MRWLLLGVAMLGLAGAPTAQPPTPGPAVVLVTLDGARIEEMFGGLDREILRSTLEGSKRPIAGNPARGSRVHLTNRHRFSYPGYSEMLVGRAHDDTIKSNDPVRNPYTTILEFIKARADLSREQVAVFASWSVFDAITEHTEGSLTIRPRRRSGRSAPWSSAPAGAVPLRRFAAGMSGSSAHRLAGPCPRHGPRPASRNSF
ncbi:MAG: hypothetical protein OEW19_19815 [Acidobacteriota bacterium]|nr:hypothetical protein [Acidobacteriota bacterium]